MNKYGLFKITKDKICFQPRKAETGYSPLYFWAFGFRITSPRLKNGGYYA